MQPQMCAYSYTNTMEVKQTLKTQNIRMSLQVAAFPWEATKGWLDDGEKRHACDREVTMKSRQNEKSNWKTTGRVENSFSKLQR